MHFLACVAGLVLLSVVLWDAFETVILPRRVIRTFRLGRSFFRSTWLVWSTIAKKIRSTKLQQSYLSYYGPLTLLQVFALWALILVFSFALLQWASGTAVGSAKFVTTFRTDLYLSGSTFFTLGMGDVTPVNTAGRIVAVLEAGTGYGFLAVLISYLPTMYGAFSQREVNISLFDARAGSPPTAAELLRRQGKQRIENGLASYLHDWETWSAQLMESHLTYPVLCFFRSQHDNQSWLAAFTAILDVCALLIAYGDGETKWQAQLTFAISRHAVADLAQVLKVSPDGRHPARLPAKDLPLVRGLLLDCGVPGCTDAGDAKLRELCGLYEPYLNGLSKLLMMPLPSWGVHIPAKAQSTIWHRISSSAAPASAEEPPGLEQVDSDHF